MLRAHTVLFLLAATLLAGCHFSRTNRTSLKANVSAAHEPLTARVVSQKRRPSHDASQSLYVNPSYGIALRYPLNFDLREPSGEELAEWQAAADASQSGATLVTMIEIPHDAYPNTNFVSGSLQLVVIRGITAESCRSLAAPQDDLYLTGMLHAHDADFAWRERESVAEGTSYEDRDYAGSFAGACYEFSIEVGVSDLFEPEAGIKPADTEKILRHLEKIISSMRLRPPSPQD